MPCSIRIVGTDGFIHAEARNALVHRLTPVALAGADYRPTAEIVVPPVQLNFVEEGPQDILLVIDDVPRALNVSFEEGLAAREPYWQQYGASSTHVIFLTDIVPYSLHCLNDIANWLPCMVKELWFTIWAQADLLALDWDGEFGPSQPVVALQ